MPHRADNRSLNRKVFSVAEYAGADESRRQPCINEAIGSVTGGFPTTAQTLSEPRFAKPQTNGEPGVTTYMVPLP
jgi:hypothetical protein